MTSSVALPDPSLLIRWQPCDQISDFLLGEFQVTACLSKLLVQVAEFGSQILFRKRLGAAYIGPRRSANLDQPFVLEEFECCLSRVPGNSVLGSQLPVRREPRTDRKGHSVGDLLSQLSCDLATCVALRSFIRHGLECSQLPYVSHLTASGAAATV